MLRLREKFSCCKTKSEVAICLLGSLLFVGCVRTSSHLQLQRTNLIQQDIPDYAKVNVSVSDKNSQILKFCGQVGDYAFSPNGNVLVVMTYADDLPEIKKQPPAKRIYSVLHFWNLKTHRLIKYMTFKDQEVYEIAFSPDGRYLVAVINQEAGYNKFPDTYLYIWNAYTGKILKHMLLFHSSDQAYSPSLVFSPKGHLLALNFLTGILLVDTSSSRKVRWLEMRDMLQPQENNLAFSPDGKLIAGASCNLNAESPTAWTLTAWKAQTGKAQLYLDNSKFILDRHDVDACIGSQVNFLPDNHTLVASNYLIDTHDLARGAEVLLSKKSLPKLNNTQYLNLGTYITNDKQFAVITCWGKDPKLVLWDLKLKRVLRTWKGAFTQHPPHTPPRIKFSPDGKRIILNIDSDTYSNTLQIWNIP